ncbi:AAA domain-containing protein [Natronomonas sp. EA1]|uniref:AAA domain-containing protein n=1 Tax=Natronomonas sp. EA1 TaxID=3421655 RepID=UPI003EBB48B8
MNIRGPVVDPGETRTVSTSNGETELAEVTVKTERGAGEKARITLWGKWTETADLLEEGMDLLVTDVAEDEFKGEIQYKTTRESFVVLEPDFLVDVTDIREWVQCPRMYWLSKISATPLKYPVIRGTIVHEVFGDLLRGRDLEAAIEDRVEEAGLELGLLGKEVEEVTDEVETNAAAIEDWLAQGRLTEADEWRSEQMLISETFGVKGRADAVRRGGPVELKTGKNLKRDPRFQDKVQAACYALLLGEREGFLNDTDAVSEAPNTGSLLYTKNRTLERTEESGHLSPEKEFSIGPGFLKYVVRQRNGIAAAEFDTSIPTGYEGNAKCEYCFEQDTCMVVAGRLDQESKAGAIGTPVPDEEQAYFDRFYRAIEAERRAVHREYRKLWEQTPEERAEDDRALIGLEPAGGGQLPTGEWALRVRRSSDAVSKIREGDVVLASDGHPTRGNAEVGRVDVLDDHIVVRVEEPLEVRRLDVYPSEFGVDRMLSALHDFVLKSSPEKKDVLFGRREPEFSGEEETYIDNNAAQNEAVNLAVRAEDGALIHGPPGTGKTYTLARTVRALVDRGERVLLSAFTNSAVDNALEALREQGFDDFVRVGTKTGVREDMQDARLETRGDPDERARELREAPVVAATTSSCGSRHMLEQAFDVTVIDEAGQLTEPGALAAINRADRWVLVGDHQQLPPVVQSEGEAGEDAADLATSLFERLIETYSEAGVMLDSQYRMSQRIQYFSSQEFYDGALRPATPEVAGRTLADLGVDREALPTWLRDPVTVVDPDGTRVGNTNPGEAATVEEAVRAYVAAGVPKEDIGVIAPFRAQVAEISRRLPDVTVDTVDRFQGSSKEVVVISFVASGDLEGPIFEDHRRVNVALTRAKRALLLVADGEALQTDPFYERMLRWAVG